MFLSKDDLKLAYGVDLEIGETYVNRAVPENNLYWKNRKIYIPESPGYYFMPIYADLLLRLGVPRSIILSEELFLVCEKILHAAALLEYKKMNWNEHVAYLSDDLLPHIKNHVFFEEVKSYLSTPEFKSATNRLGTPFPSLNRADSYLFVLACIPEQDIPLESAIKSWYAIMTYFLILDDLVDIKEDLRNQEENAFIEAGFDRHGLAKIEKMIANSHDNLISVNPVLANRIDHKQKTMDLTGLIRSILSE